MLKKTPTHVFVTLVLIFVTAITTRGQEVVSDSVTQHSTIKHTSKGFVFTTSDKNYELQIAGRLQFRFSSPFDQDPVTFDDFAEEKSTTFKINRARLKIGGHAYRPWLTYYFEYELSQSNLLDFKVMIEKYTWLSFKAGQWKTDYNRERVISSGEQEMVERSLINRPFTLDRQQGVAVYGHLKSTGAADFNYWVSVLTGTGRGSRANDDDKLMYVARLQWNPLGRSVDMSGSDLIRTPKPALLIAVAGVTNTSSYTRFSQSGGSSLEDFDSGLPGQYRINQCLVETAYKHNGFSWQQEAHWKNIDDRINQTQSTMVGSYWQAGYFFNEWLSFFPKELELAGRFAIYRPDIDIPDNTQREYSLAANWFFKAGHKNKLTAEYSFLAFDDEGLEYSAGSRVRVQWDISF